MTLEEKLISKHPDELRTICRTLKIKGYSGLKKTELIELLLEHSALVKNYFKPSFSEKLKKHSATIALCSLILGTLYFFINLYLKSNENVIEKDFKTVPVTIIRTTQNQYMSLADISAFHPDSEQFSNYKYSLQSIDYPFAALNVYNGLEDELKIKFTIPKPNKETIILNPINILENSFWNWMTIFPQEYGTISVEKKETMAGEGLSGKTEGWESPKLKFVPVESSKNELVNFHRLALQLPTEGTLTNDGYSYKINTRTCDINLNFRAGGGRSMNYGGSNFTSKIYEIFNMPKSKRYLAEELEIKVEYERKSGMFLNKKLAEKEYNWYKRIVENLENDFSFNILKNKLEKIDPTANIR